MTKDWFPWEICYRPRFVLLPLKHVSQQWLHMLLIIELHPSRCCVEEVHSPPRFHPSEQHTHTARRPLTAVPFERNVICYRGTSFDAATLS